MITVSLHRFVGLVAAVLIDAIRLVNWPRYNDVVQSIEEAQKLVAKGLLAILSLPQRVQPIDQPEPLRNPANIGHGKMLCFVSTSSHANQSTDYAIGEFVDVLAEAAVKGAEKELGSKAQEHYRVAKTSVIRARDELKSSLEALSLGLREAAALRAASTLETDEMSEEEKYISARYVHCCLYSSKVLIYVGAYSAALLRSNRQLWSVLCHLLP